jgi:hypothetical protein
MRLFFKGHDAGNLLANVATIGVAATILSLGTGFWLAQSGEHRLRAGKSSEIVYSQRVRSVLDPETTGSISQSANATRLDPCAVERQTN